MATAEPARADQRELLVYIAQMCVQLAAMAPADTNTELVVMLNMAAEEAQLSVARIDLDEG